MVLIKLAFHQNVVFEEGVLGQGVFFGKDPFVDFFLFPLLAFLLCCGFLSFDDFYPWNVLPLHFCSGVFWWFKHFCCFGFSARIALDCLFY